MTLENTNQQVTRPSVDRTAWQQLCVDFRIAVRSDVPLLISGDPNPSRLLARLVHEMKPPGGTDSRFVVVDHAALSEGLASFQAVYTSVSNHPHGAPAGDTLWTLYIENVDQLTLAAQDLLFYFMDVVHASDSPAEADQGRRTVRVVTTTTTDLTDCATLGTFRWNLLYRLNVIRLVVPTTRGGHADTPKMVNDLLSETTVGPPDGSLRLSAHALGKMFASDRARHVNELPSVLAALGGQPTR